MRLALRALSTALITAGAVILLNVGVTLAWQEPVSGLQSWLSQRDAKEALAHEVEEHRLGPEQLSPREVRGAARRFQRSLRDGEAFGRIRVPSMGLTRVVIHGTDTDSLREGPGHYPETSVPGLPGTVAVAGHRTTYGAPFRRIDSMGEGDEVILDMPYARFVYRFTRSEVVEPTATEVVQDIGTDRIVLTACHPVYSAAERYVMSAELDRIEALPD